jgi:hypothetical protein
VSLASTFTQPQIFNGLRVPATVPGWLAEYATPEDGENWLLNEARTSLVIDLAGHGPGHYRIAVFWGQKFPEQPPGIASCGSCKCAAHRAFFLFPADSTHTELQLLAGVGGQPLCAVPLRFDSEQAADDWSALAASKIWLSNSVGLVVPLVLT